ncbi:uncharacterized protein LOC129911871 [Episyrphus balteatus]|uniref:uncharacterized protein LOC129911871 n=1 Tax=Episyrphus balteatus TaxID=286459 RepID=UPI00248516D7|nr:uncharacterized protein LOC129911871 [Episyrphus balteatus]
MNRLFLIGLLVLAVAAFNVNAECVDGELKQPAEGEVATEDKDSDLSVFFKKVGCSLKKGAGKVQEGAKKLGGEIKEGAKKFKESAKKFGSNVKTKFGEFKDKLSDSSEETVVTTPHTLFISQNVELINTDVAKAEQKCGNGYILDVLGECKKL